MLAVSRLPQLTELDISSGWGWDACKSRLPLGVFSNLSKLVVQGGWDVSFFISGMATVISNSPRLKSLAVFFIESRDITLGSLFAKVPTNNPPMCLTHLSIGFMDATVDQVTLPHLKKLTSFQFEVLDRQIPIAQSTWASFLANNIELSHVEIYEVVTEETMFYLSSLSGLRRLEIGNTIAPQDTTMEKLRDMFFTGVLPKHTQTLRTLHLADEEWVNLPYYTFCAFCTLTDHHRQAFDHANSKSIMKCLKLRDLSVYIDGKESSMPVVSLAVSV
jgi:hypothetical protein